MKLGNKKSYKMVVVLTTGQVLAVGYTTATYHKNGSTYYKKRFLTEYFPAILYEAI